MADHNFESAESILTGYARLRGGNENKDASLPMGNKQGKTTKKKAPRRNLPRRRKS